MPQIQIQAETFERLQRHAKPLLDTTDSVINRALQALEESADSTVPKRDSYSNRGGRVIDPRNLPNLTHTKVLAASISGDPIAKPKWNPLVDEMLRRALKHLGSFQSVVKFFPINMVQGRKEDDGYVHLHDIDVSVQRVDANGAGRALVTAAQSLGICLDIDFMWRQRDDALHPGERARLKVD